MCVDDGVNGTDSREDPPRAATPGTSRDDGALRSADPKRDLVQASRAHFSFLAEVGHCLAYLDAWCIVDVVAEVRRVVVGRLADDDDPKPRMRMRLRWGAGPPR